MQRLCPLAAAGVQHGSTVSYSLPRGTFDAAMPASLQQHSKKHDIDEWSLAQPSLEEVFVAIAHKYTYTRPTDGFCRDFCVGPVACSRLHGLGLGM